MSEESFTPSFDGTKLYTKIDPVADAKGAVVIVHGLCEHQGRYDYLTGKLNEAGYSVYRFDHRGHGRSEGTQVYYDDHDQIIEDTNVFVEMALAACPDIPVFLLGHSMGGYAVASFGTKYPGKVSGYVMSGAWTRDNKGLAANVPAGHDVLEYIPNELGDGVCSDPEVGRAYVADPYVIMKMSFGLFYSVQEGHRWLKEHAADFSDPVILLHGANDGLVDPRDSMQFFEEISSADKSLRIYAKLFHEIFNEPCKDLVIRDAVEWLDQHA